MRSNDGLSINQLVRAAPSALATTAHPNVSPKYKLVSSLDMVEGLERSGFFPVEARQNNQKNRLFARHVIRFRRQGDSAINGVFREVILTNSHDGSSAFKLSAGFFRLVCANGLVVGSIDASVSVPHRGDAVERARVEAQRLIDNARRSAGRIDLLRSRRLDEAEQLDLAKKAQAIRWGDAIPFHPSALLTPRRHEDRGDDLWSIFNRIQENLIRGGMRTFSENYRRSRARPIASITEDIRINRELWNAVETII